MEPAGTPGSATIAFAVDAAGAATLTIRSAAGAVVKTIDVQAGRGLNIVKWNLLTVASANLRPAAPGEYRVELSAGGRTANTTLRLDRFVRWTR